MTEKLVVEYYSDVLCIWAWIAQRRVDELIQEFGDQVEVHYHYIDIFGDTHTKIHTQWETRGKFEGFAEHVQHAVGAYDYIHLHPDIWKQSRPASSANAHLILKAVELVDGLQASQIAALHVRKAFFSEARNIGELGVLKEILTQQNISLAAIEKTLLDGSAIAALMTDYQQAKAQSLKGSPSYVMNSGRQTLYGNVGYRVLQANVEELLYRPESEASWC